MKRIKLTQGKYTTVDNEDFERINQFKWYAHYRNGNWYAIRNTKRINSKQTLIRMHRFIMNCPKKLEIDHISHNTLDNQKVNLRICTRSQNNMNRKIQQKRETSSKYKGVSWHKSNKKWEAQIKLNGKNIYLGIYKIEVEAARAYDKKAKELFGEFANLNFE
jgi:flagellar basal body P-ring protein FlgI